MTGRGGRRQPDDLPGKGGLSPRFREFAAADDSSIMAHDRRVTAGVVDFLKKRRRGEGPFFLFAGYLAPHFPLIVPQAYWERYRDRVPMPVIPPGFLDSLPLNYKHLRAGFQMENVPPDLVKKGRELYHGLTQWFDDQVGIVLRTLADSEVARNTVIIYTADHGENMGEHGLWWKNAVYDHAARVPLLVSWPERWAGGQRRAGACSMVDLVRTIAEIGGADTPGDWNGDSLCRWMDDPKTKWKDLAVSQYYAHNIASGYNMIRQGDCKYVYHTRMDATHGPSCELYDLKSDPDEFKNLASDPAQKSRIDAMHAVLVKELGEDPDEIELRCRAEYAKGYVDVPGGQGKKGGGKKGRGKGAKKAKRAAAALL
jgi:choline-sulfatase